MSTATNTPPTEHRFIEPLDVLFLRGNKLFGSPGSHGESLVPPWPSAAAGALRSHMLSHDGTELNAFAQGDIHHPSLGTPTAPGSFAVTAFHVAQRQGDGRIRSLHAIPADLVVTETGGKAEPADFHIQSLRPCPVNHGLQSSSRFTHTPVLAETERRKATSGMWLTQQGWQRYLHGQLPKPKTDLIKASDLWAMDARIGIGLNADTRSVDADEGKLFTAQAVVFKPGIGFVASVCGAQLPEHGMLRLGGDGRAANSQSVTWQTPQADLQAIAAQGRCRIVLTTPGLFNQGWLPHGFTLQNNGSDSSDGSDGSFWLDLHGVRARLVCASVPRSETISGWDLARWQPKPAMRSAPTGSVYWLDQLQATPQALCNLADAGFWSAECEDAQRRAEGFNRFSFAAYDCTQ